MKGLFSDIIQIMNHSNATASGGSMNVERINVVTHSSSMQNSIHTMAYYGYYGYNSMDITEIEITNMIWICYFNFRTNISILAS